MKKIYYYLSFTLIVFFSFQTKASHFAGGDITYQCLGNNQYKVKLTLFRDCFGTTMNASETIEFSNTCGITGLTNVSAALSYSTEVSQLCPADSLNSTCNGGSLPGMQMYVYEATVTLAPCNSWTISWTNCCHNVANLNFNSNTYDDIYIFATVNNQTKCDNSPYFTSQPIPYVCNNQLVTYNFGTSEVDGDSLVYSLVAAQTAAGTNVAYNGGYSASSPLPGITIDANTGQLSFTPTLQGIFTVVVEVKQYDKITGLIIGTIRRELQIIVQNCSNNVPSPSQGQLTATTTTFTGNATVTGPYTMKMCDETGDFTMTTTFSDPDITDSLIIIPNFSSTPGATITRSGKNPATVTISWQAPPGSAGSNASFTILVKDGKCPIVGQQFYTYNISILPKTIGFSDTTLCIGQSAVLTAKGGKPFNWVVLSGDPITGSNFVPTNTNKDTVTVTPALTTVYEITGTTIGNGCVNKDTITVTVVPDFGFNVSQSSNSTCLLTTVQLNTTVSPTGTYSYQWSNSTGLSSSNIPNPTFTATQPGNYTKYLTIQSAAGCKKIDTITINAIAAYPPLYTATTPPYVCPGDTAVVSLAYISTPPASCGVTNVGCGSSPSTYSVGTQTGQNSDFTFPAPFGNYYKNAKHQFLFSAAELNAAGVQAGKIDRLIIPISQVNGLTTYPNYTIRMSCTDTSYFGANATATTFTSFVSSGMLTVYNPKNVTITTGNNILVFDQAFVWDGFKNIIVETCYDITSNFTDNSITPYTTTAFNSCQVFYSDNVVACTTTPSSIFNFLVTKNRPIMSFGNCPSEPSTTNYTMTVTPIAPTPTTGIAISADNDTVKIKTTTPGTYTYSVSVLNPIGGCTKDTIITINVSNPITDAITTPNTSICEGSTLTLSATNAASYIWYYKPTSTSSVTIANTATTSVTPPGTTNTYIVEATGFCAGATKDYDTVVVTVTPKAQLVLAPTVDKTRCIGQALTIVVGAGSSTPGSTGTPYSYQWVLNGTPSVGTNTFTIPGTVTSGSIVVTVTGNCAIPATDTILFNSLPNNVAIDIIDSAAVCSSSSLVLNTLTSNGYSPFNYNWSYVPSSGSISNSSVLNTTAPSSEGTYTLAVSVTDSCGFSNAAIQVITVFPPCDIEIPNVISPNGDGVNDAFVIKNLGYHPNSKLTIYDRWGKKTFENDNYQNDWKADGSSDGTYFYVLDVPDDKQYNGFITVYHK